MRKVAPTCIGVLVFISSYTNAQYREFRNESLYEAPETPKTNTTTYQYPQYNNVTTLKIKDADYYRRLDEIAERDADNCQYLLEKAIGLYGQGKYLDCEYYAKQAESYRVADYYGDIYSLLVATYTNLGNKQKACKYYRKAYKKTDPSMLKRIERIYKEAFNENIHR